MQTDIAPTSEILEPDRATALSDDHFNGNRVQVDSIWPVQEYYHEDEDFGGSIPFHSNKLGRSSDAVPHPGFAAQASSPDSYYSLNGSHFEEPLAGYYVDGTSSHSEANGQTAASVSSVVAAITDSIAAFGRQQDEEARKLKHFESPSSSDKDKVIPPEFIHLPRDTRSMSADLSASFSNLSTNNSGYSFRRSDIWPPAVSLGSPLTASLDRRGSVTGFSLSETESDASPRDTDGAYVPSTLQPTPMIEHVVYSGADAESSASQLPPDQFSHQGYFISPSGEITMDPGYAVDQPVMAQASDSGYAMMGGPAGLGDALLSTNAGNGGELLNSIQLAVRNDEALGAHHFAQLAFPNFRRSMSMPNITPTQQADVASVTAAVQRQQAAIHHHEDRKRMKPFHTKATQILLARRWTIKEEECQWGLPTPPKKGKDLHSGPGITAKVLFAQKKFVWEWDRTPQGEKAKIEVPFSSVCGVSMCRVNPTRLAVTVEMTEPAKAVLGIQMPKTSTKWHPATDGTDPTQGAVNVAKVHSLYFSNAREKELLQALTACKELDPSLARAMERGVDVSQPVEFTIDELYAIEKLKKSEHARKKRTRESSVESPGSKLGSPGPATPLSHGADPAYSNEVAVLPEGSAIFTGANKRRKSIGSAYTPRQQTWPITPAASLLGSSTCGCVNGCATSRCPCMSNGQACQSCPGCTGGHCSNPWTYLYFSGVNLEVAKKDQLFLGWLNLGQPNAKQELERDVNIICGCGIFPRKLRDCIGGVSCTLCGSSWTFANVLEAKEEEEQQREQAQQAAAAAGPVFGDALTWTPAQPVVDDLGIQDQLAFLS